MSFLLGAAAIALVFGVVIFVHELGHFLVAKKSGVRVERFSFGMGPELFGFQWGETRYCLAAIPLGGEVRMAGDSLESEDPQAHKDPRDFYAKPWWVRSLVVLAGPGMNYVLAFFLFTFMAGIWGDARPSTEPVVGDLMKGYPAQMAGLQPQDRVLSVAGTPVSTWKGMAASIHGNPEKKISITVERGDDRLVLSLTPRKDPASGVGLIGIAPAVVYLPVGWGQAWIRGADQTVGWTLLTVKYLGDKLIRWQKPELSGPVGIAAVVAKAARHGWQDLLFFMALISVGIGLFNLFPIPLLDGGHLIFFLWEAVTRRPPTKSIMRWANAAGLALLMSILIFATYSDIERLRPVKADPGVTEVAP